MPRRELPSITAETTIGDLPGFDAALELDSRGKGLADLFHDRPELPGALLTERGVVRSAASRRYYLETIGRYCGRDLYLPRPIRLMMERFESLGGTLVLPPGTGIEEAVRCGLARHPDLVYEPLVVASRSTSGPGASARLVDFETLLVADSKLTLLRNAQMAQILDTVRDGLLLLSEEQMILGEYSRAVESLFESDRIAGRRWGELLATMLDSDRVELAESFVATLFDPNVIEALVARINPLARVEARFPASGRRKLLSFRFARGAQTEGARTLLVRIEDITRAEELALQVAAERERSERRLALALSLVEVAPEALGDLLERLERTREELGRAVESWRLSGAERTEVDAAFRAIHGLKGEAGLVRFEPARRELHQLEDRLEALRRGAGGEAVEAAGTRLDQLGALLDETREIVGHFSRLAGGGSARRLDDGLGLLSGLARFVEEIAVELGKPARFVSRVTERELPSASLGMLREVLVQLARNAVVHGVEPPAERRRAGKPAVATLQLAARAVDEEWIELVFQDDGCGIEWAEVRRRAEERGLDAVTPDELGEVLFLPGFTTARATTAHAGRGVGLDLVRRRVLEAGGSVAVHSEPGRFCAFQIHLPSLVGVSR